MGTRLPPPGPGTAVRCARLDDSTRIASALWDVWGTYAFLAVGRPELMPEARRIAQRVLTDVDAACSRFRADSALSTANRSPGSWVPAHPLLVAATRVAITAAELTDGLVDPCLGRTMVSLGYDRDLGLLDSRPSQAAVPLAAPQPGAWRDIGVRDDAVRVPPGVALDLGATAKAWAADLVAGEIVASLGCPVVVSLGGDLRVLGPDHEPTASWPVRIAEHPDDLNGGVEVTVTDGLATSSTVVRRWKQGSTHRHHLVDPRTGAPVSEVFRTVTAAGDTCVGANTASTAALVLGAAAPAWLTAHRVTARLVAHDGSVVTTGAWPAFPSAPPSEVHHP